MADERRITDLSEVEAENIKARNTKFLQGDAHYDILDHQTKKELREQIWRVRNSDLRKVINRFPTDRPLQEQCALWMHALVGKHFFPDANHRTAMALLRMLLDENGIEPGEWATDRTEEARDESHRVRREIGRIHLDQIYEQDELYDVWYDYFGDVLKE